MTGAAEQDVFGARVAYTPAEVAAAAGLSRKAIYRAIESGELRAARVCRGSRLLVPVEALREWIDGNLMPHDEHSRHIARAPATSRAAGRPLRDALEALASRPAGYDPLAKKAPGRGGNRPGHGAGGVASDARDTLPGAGRARGAVADLGAGHREESEMTSRLPDDRRSSEGGVR